MSKARELANLLEADGDVISAGLDNVPASDWDTLLNVPAWANTDTRDASNINAGTLPNARITDLPNAQVAGLAASATTDTTDGSNIASGTVDIARLPSTAVNSNVDLTTLSASNLTSGTLADARFPATLPAINGSAVTSIAAGNISTGTVAAARLGSGTGGSGNYLRGDGSWTTNCTNHSNCSNCSGTSSHSNCSNCSGTGNGTITGGSGTASVGQTSGLGHNVLSHYLSQSGANVTIAANVCNCVCNCNC
tara:strand:+ start:51 stop:803 length:753 start_codon:yes stop_codon:yes gene_type:complete